MNLNKLYLPPMFVPANVQFMVDGQPHFFAKEGISVFGTVGLYSHRLNPFDMVGREIGVDLNILASPPFRIHTKALLTAQVTTDTAYIGLKWLLSDLNRMRLGEAIKREGFYPTQYIRKYPRIPASDELPHMPIRAIMMTPDAEVIAFDIANMSPNGILLSSENFKASVFTPGAQVVVQVEPRGGFFESFEVEGVVRRVVMDKNVKSGHITRYLGIRFTRIVDEGEENFRRILRAVLESIVATAEGSAESSGPKR